MFLLSFFFLYVLSFMRPRNATDVAAECALRPTLSLGLTVCIYRAAGRARKWSYLATSYLVLFPFRRRRKQLELPLFSPVKATARECAREFFRESNRIFSYISLKIVCKNSDFYFFSKLRLDVSI